MDHHRGTILIIGDPGREDAEFLVQLKGEGFEILRAGDLDAAMTLRELCTVRLVVLELPDELSQAESLIRRARQFTTGRPLLLIPKATDEDLPPPPGPSPNPP